MLQKSAISMDLETVIHIAINLRQAWPPAILIISVVGMHKCLFVYSLNKSYLE